MAQKLVDQNKIERKVELTLVLGLSNSNRMSSLNAFLARP
jgi:hypothetical protein